MTQHEMQERNATIRRYIENGVPAKTVARRFGIGATRVRQIAPAGRKRRVQATAMTTTTDRLDTLLAKLRTEITERQQLLSLLEKLAA